MRRARMLVGVLLAMVLLCGCLSTDAKKAVTLHNELYQSFARDVKDGRTTREQEQQFIMENAATMDSMARMVVGDPAELD